MPLKIAGNIYETGAGVFTAPPGPGVGGARSIVIGVGIPTAPVISYKPNMVLPVDMYVTSSGGPGNNFQTVHVPWMPPTALNPTNVLSWRDRRMQ